MAIDEADFEVLDAGPSKAEIGSKGLPLAVAQGLTFGLGDEIQGALAALPIAAMKGVSIPDAYREGRDISRAQLNEFKEQNKKTALAAEMAGMIGTIPIGGAVGAVAKQAAPNLTQKAITYAAENPLKTASAIGALSGGAYGAGTSEGDFQETAKDAAIGGVVGGVAGPALARLAQFLPKPKPASLAERAAAIQAKRTGRITPPMTGPSNAPVAPMTSTQGMVARLPTGAQKMDVDLMRAEESARQGLLGPVAQTQAKQMDEVFRGDVQDIVKGLAGEGQSTEVFANAASKVKSRFDAEKRLATSLIEKRNDALGRASVYKKYAQETLGKDVDDLLATPEIKASVAMLGPDNAINRSVGYLKKLTSEGDQKAINFAEVAAWRKSLNNLPPASTEYQIGKQLSAKYDNWLENISKQALINADDDIVDKIFKANANYREFKTKYGTDKYRGQAKIIEDIVTKSELSPLELSNAIMGAGVKGRTNSAQIVKRMIDIMPEAKRPEMIADLRRGLILRAAENAYSKGGADGKMSLSTFRNELRQLKSNEAYNKYLKDPEFDKTVNGLASDITKFLEAQSRKDVYSPSGGAVARSADKILGAIGVLTTPIGSKLVFDPVRAGIKAGAEEASIRPTRKAFQQSLDEFMKEVMEKNLDSRRIYGAATSGIVSDSISDKRPFLKDAAGNQYNYDDFEEIE